MHFDAFSNGKLPNNQPIAQTYRIHCVVAEIDARIKSFIADLLLCGFSLIGFCVLCSMCSVSYVLCSVVVRFSFIGGVFRAQLRDGSFLHFAANCSIQVSTIPVVNQNRHMLSPVGFTKTKLVRLLCFYNRAHFKYCTVSIKMDYLSIILIIRLRIIIGKNLFGWKFIVASPWSVVLVGWIVLLYSRTEIISILTSISEPFTSK